MRQRSRIIFIVLMLAIGGFLLSPPAALAQEPPTAPGPPTPPASTTPSAPDPANAATFYRKAIEKYHEFSERTREEMNFALSEFEADPSRGPSLEVRQMLKRLQPVLSSTLNASRRPSCDFRIDFADSSTRYSDFGDVRWLAHILCYDYLARIEDQDVRGVVECLVTMHRMAAHVSQQRLLVGSLAGSALMARVDDRLDVALDHALIGPVEATVLLRELDRFTGPDPMGYLPALAHEKTLIAGTLEKRFSGEDAVEQFRDMYRESFPDDDQAEPALERLTPERLQTMFASFSRAAAGMAEAFANPDSGQRDAAIVRIRSEVEGSEFANLAKYFMVVDADMLRLNMERTRKEIDDRRRLLRGIASGEIDPMSLANAAVWYIRATRQVEAIDPDKRRAVDAYAAKHDVPADATLTAILARHDMQEVIGTLSTAAHLPRSDWSYAAGHWPNVFRRYHAGLLWCGRLLVADAARMIHAQRYDEAAARLETAYLLSADLTTDGTVGGSLSAHRVFADVDALADAAIDGRLLESSHIALLQEAVRRFSRGDPFHYQPAIATMRRNLEFPVRYWVQGLPAGPPEFSDEVRDTADAIRESLDTDRLLSLAIIYDHWEPLYYGTFSPYFRKNDMNAALAGLESIFDVKAARGAGDFAPVLTEWAKSKQMEQVRTAAFPKIAPLAERARQSLSDFRKCLLRFERFTSE